MAKLGEYKNFRICKTCNVTKPLSREYFKRHSGHGSNGFNYECKECNLISKISNNIKDGLIFCHSCKSFKCEEDFNTNNASHFEYRLFKERRCSKCKSKEMFASRKSKTGDDAINRTITERFLAARLRSRKHNLEFSITKKYLFELLELQNNKCAISGIALTFILGNGRIPTNVSIDKIDGNLGYTNDNIQLVCMAVNQMKSDMSMNELYNFCEKILENKNNYGKEMDS